jgi:hypothetical protein
VARVIRPPRAFGDSASRQRGLPDELTSGVTADADSIDDSALARDLGDRLGWRTWIPALDGATAQTGKVPRRLRGNAVKQVEFLSGVVGLTTQDIVRRAVELKVGSATLPHMVAAEFVLLSDHVQKRARAGGGLWCRVEVERIQQMLVGRCRLL